MPHQKFNKLLRDFYNRPTLEICQDILGKYIIYNAPECKLSAKIVEVEAYIAMNDPASHAYRGKTERNKPMFGTPGFSYVYLIYGMYNCFNFVTEPEGQAAAILLRGAEPEEGIDFFRSNSRAVKDYQLLNGPGKFCRSFNINLVHNNIDLTGELIYLEDRNQKVKNIIESSRIGIKSGQEKLWRFYDNDSMAVSVKKNRNKVGI
ncbi:MAG: DNA-3-methyladenine glycosylase [candidate division Zixibacteria bacterium]|nr:DNA-3-methyladenine glycosylase [candidate division Zixibacteria bacterium]